MHAQQLREQLADARGGRVVFLSHCLLNENVRYLGGAGRPGGVSEVVAEYLGRGIGICQLPCPEQRAWGGILKPRMLVAYGSEGTLRAPASRLLLRPFIWYTRHVYARLARAVARDIADYRRSGMEVIGLVGVGASPSCGVATTLDLTTAVSALTRCPAARLDRVTLNQDIIAANVQPGEGLFMRAIRRRLARADAGIPKEEHDLLAELGVRSRGAARPGEQDYHPRRGIGGE
jgi:predicted secreted protein